VVTLSGVCDPVDISVPSYWVDKPVFDDLVCSAELPRPRPVLRPPERPVRLPALLFAEALPVLRVAEEPRELLVAEEPLLADTGVVRDADAVPLLVPDAVDFEAAGFDEDLVAALLDLDALPLAVLDAAPRDADLDAPPRDDLDAAPRDADLDAPPREDFDAAPRDADLDAPPREDFDAAPRDADLDAPPREDFDAAPRDADLDAPPLVDLDATLLDLEAPPRVDFDAPPLEDLPADLDAPPLEDFVAAFDPPRAELLLAAALLLPFDVPFEDLDAPFEEPPRPEEEPPRPEDDPPLDDFDAPFLEADFEELRPELLLADFLEAAFLVDFAMLMVFRVSVYVDFVLKLQQCKLFAKIILRYLRLLKKLNVQTSSRFNKHCSQYCLNSSLFSYICASIFCEMKNSEREANPRPTQLSYSTSAFEELLIKHSWQT
jgi:hypothetical protein